MREHRRVMSVKGRRSFRTAVNLIAQDPEIRSSDSRVNVREVERTTDEASGKAIFYDREDKAPDVNILIDRRNPNVAHTFLHELGHLKDREIFRYGLGERSAEAFANRKEKELGIEPLLDRGDYPFSAHLPLSKYDRRGIVRRVNQDG